MSRSTSRFRVGLAAACLTVAFADAAHATLTVMPGPVDTPTALDLTWLWNPEAETPNTTDNSSSPALTNWTVHLTLFPDGAGGWLGAASARHLTDPHPGDAPSAPLVILDQPAGTGNFTVPTLGNALALAAVVEHPDVGHLDQFALNFTRGLAPAGNSIRIQGSHVPEPLAVAALGAALLAARRRHAPGRQ